MKVRVGFNSPFGREKYDVEVSEEDLLRILADPRSGLLNFRDKLTAEEAWGLLDAEARWLAEHALARLLASQDANAALAAKDRAKSAAGERASIIKGLRIRLGLEKQDDGDGKPGA